jgi:hypothetical protein
MPKELALKNRILLEDDLQSLMKYIYDEFLNEYEIMNINYPDESQKKWILQELVTLQSEARSDNAVRVILALEHIINAFPIIFLKFDDLLINDSQAIYNEMSNIIIKVEKSFESPFSPQTNIDKSAIAELEEIYERTQLDKNLLIVELLRNSIQQKDSNGLEELVLRLKQESRDTEVYESHLYRLFLDIFTKDDLDGFKILFENSEFYQLFQKEEISLLNNCIYNDTARICQFILEKQENVYQKYNAAKIGQLILDTGSLIGLNSVFTNNERAEIYKRYELDQFTKNGNIFWQEEGKEEMQLYNATIISAHIISTEEDLKKKEGSRYEEFKINKQVCNINELAKLAALHDAPKCLEILTINSKYDGVKLPTSHLASYAASENAPESLKFLLKEIQEDFNLSYSGAIPDIILLAKHAITNHADNALKVILDYTKFTLAYIHDEMEGPILFLLLNEAIAAQSIECHQILLDREDYEFEGQYAEMLENYFAPRKCNISSKEHRNYSKSEDEDSGCEKSYPASPDSTNSAFDFNNLENSNMNISAIEEPNHIQACHEASQIILGGNSSAFDTWQAGEVF